MRALILTVLLAATALGQASVELATFSIDPFADMVRPLQSPVSTTMHARVSCALADGIRGVPVQYQFVEAPAWATVVSSPASDVLATESCEGGWLIAESMLIVTVSDQAPGFVPTPIVVELVAGPSGREERRSASVNVTASYFSIVDVQVPESIVTMAPGSERALDVVLTNFGNGDTRIEIVVERASPEITVTAPDPFVLESKQAGGNDISRTVAFRVQAAPADGLVNRVATFDARVHSAYAKDDSFVGDASTVSFVVTVQSPLLRDRQVPAMNEPWLALVVAALLVSARRK